MLKRFVKNVEKFLFGKRVLVIQFEPIKRGISKELMFGNEQISRAWFDFLYDYMVQEFLNYNNDRAKIAQDMLRDVRTLADNGGYKIDFSISAKQNTKTNTSK